MRWAGHVARMVEERGVYRVLVGKPEGRMSSEQGLGLVQKTSRKNVTSTVWIFSFFCLFDGRHGWKNHSRLNWTALKQKKKKHAHSGKEREAHRVEKWRLSCDIDAPQVGSARFESTRVVKVNRKTNRRKTRPYSIVFRSSSEKFDFGVNRLPVFSTEFPKCRQCSMHYGNPSSEICANVCRRTNTINLRGALRCHCYRP